jgi:type IV pilus modification protein PilV
MSINQISRIMTRSQSGFSMIDVLVAIIVLATGLLALGVLQAALTRNGVDARTRTQVAAYAQGLMDQMRGAGYDAFSAPSGSTCTTLGATYAAGTPPTCAATITASSSACSATSQTFLQKMQCDAYNAQTYTGVSNLSSTITTSEYYGSTGGTWVSTKPTGYSDKTPHYKDVSVATTWTDAMGQSRTMAYNTTVSPVTVTPTDNSLDTASFILSASTTPKVRESNPGTTLGVIPIALNPTSDAAATNPKPVVTNTGTTFSQYTYNSTASSYGGNLITARVDTKVIQCKCKYGGSVTNDPNLGTILLQPYRPTYWDGYHYTSPLATSGTSSTTGIDTAATQDTDCDICCRDRNDATTDTIKFDSFSGVTSHYNWVSGSLATSTDSYQQACRMIRVDGAYAVATEIHNYFFGMLPTDNCSSQGSAAAPTGCTSGLTASDTVPSSTTENTYATFVKDYLKTNLTSLKTTGQATEGSASPLTAGSTSAARYIGTTYALNAPTNITINLPNSVSRWQYARGLFIDYLESSAQTVLTNAIANCTDSDVNNCALPVLPFTTVNMTELGNWTADASGAVIKVSDTAVIGGDETSPKRGNVTVPSTQTGSNNPTANAIVSTYITNSALTGVTTQQANSQYDLTNPLTDSRQFTVSGSAGGGGGGGTAVYFTTNLTGLPWMSSVSNASLDPTVAWFGTASQIGTASGTVASPNHLVAYVSVSGSTYSAAYAGGTSTTPEPISYTNTAPIGVTVVVQNFNTSDNLGTETAICSATGQNGSVAGTTTATNATQCYNYQVDYANITVVNGGTSTNAGVTAAGVSLLSGTTDGGMKEGAVITLPATPGISSSTNTITGATSLNVPFTLQVKTLAAGTCVCNNKSCSRFTYTPGTCAN